MAVLITEYKRKFVMINTPDKEFQIIIDGINAGLTRVEFVPSLKVGRKWVAEDDAAPGYCLTAKESLVLREVLVQHKDIILPT